MLDPVESAKFNHGRGYVEAEIVVDFATDGQSASSSWCRAHDQILNFL